MTNSMRRRSPFCLLGLSAAFLSLSACGTQEIGRDPVVVSDAEPGADRGGLMFVFTPHDHTYEELQARSKWDQSLILYRLVLDGRVASYNADGTPAPHYISEGSEGMLGYFAAGPHHFEVVAPGGGSPIFAGDAEIPAGSVTRLYLFGDRGAVQGRFVSYPEVPAAGTLHASVINLVRGSPGIEVVSCADAAPCTTLSPALAFGQTFDADFPAHADQTRLALADGATVAYRQVTTAAVPDPPEQPIGLGIDVRPVSVSFSPPNLVAAPIYMSQQGDVLSFFN